MTANGVLLCQDHCPLAAVMEDGTPREAEVNLHHAAGRRVPVMVWATLLYSNDSPGSLIRRADSLMYRSKQTGRNLVTVG